MKLRVFWHKRGTGIGNFGDELGPYLISKLSGAEIIHVPLPRTGLKLLASYLKWLVVGKDGGISLVDICGSLIGGADYIMSVGSTIGWGSGHRKVWGSGILFYNENIPAATFLAVRGRYTQNRLSVLGLHAPAVLGDPAILLPLVYHPLGVKRFKVGLIPHHTQYSHFKAHDYGREISVINVMDPVEKVVDSICSCEAIVSTSLHGIIVAHAYGIPALWAWSDLPRWHGSDVKFFDYMSGVGVKEYVPYFLSVGDRREVGAIVGDIPKRMESALPCEDVPLLRKKLLDVAPFRILPEYLHRNS